MSFPPSKLLIPNQLKQNAVTEQNQKEEEETQNESTSKIANFREFSILVNGESLSSIFSNEDLRFQIRGFFEKAQSVVVFRCSPNEKAEVVKFVRGNTGIFTLAIGDGGNDVNMIQSASIGVGIMGKEGN